MIGDMRQRNQSDYGVIRPLDVPMQNVVSNCSRADDPKRVFRVQIAARNEEPILFINRNVPFLNYIFSYGLGF